MFGVYVHFPYCARRCPYCDFATVGVADLRAIPREAYLRGVLTELDRRLDGSSGLTAFSSRPVTSVFFGGGTPSLWGAGPVGQVLDALDRRLGLTGDCEITLEVNPTGVATELGPRAHMADDPELGDLAAYRSVGVNRVSLGVQSFQPHHLKTLGRLHSAESARIALRAVATVFDNWSFDLMFGLPNQTIAELEADVAELLTLAPPHVSLYQLTIEPGTPFDKDRAAGRIAPLNDELTARMYALIADRLSAAGYANYEVSNFAKPGRQARHNLTYWRMQPYLALGTGAHGDTGTTRYANPRETPAYLQALAEGSAPESAPGGLLEPPSPTAARARLDERLMLSLRIAEGLGVARFIEQAAALGLNTVAFQSEAQTLTDEGYFTTADGALRPTHRGFTMLDALLARLSDRLDNPKPPTSLA